MPVSQDFDGKRPFSARISREASNALEYLAMEWGISQTAVIESLLVTAASPGTLWDNVVKAQATLIQAANLLQEAAMQFPVTVTPQPSPRGRKPSNAPTDAPKSF